MKRKLLAQMSHEYRGNIWMVVEFIIISVIMWYVTSILYGLNVLYGPSVGYDFDDVYAINIGYLSPDAEGYVDYSDDADKWKTDIYRMRDELRNNPHVEYVGLSRNGLPFNYNYMGNVLSMVKGGDTLRYHANWRSLDGEAVKALRIIGTKGETSDQIAEHIENGRLVISAYGTDNGEMKKLADPAEFLGKIVETGGRSMEVAPLEVNYMRRVDYEPNSWGGVIFATPDSYSEFVIRIKHGHDREFAESFDKMNKHSGNIYITNLESMKHKRESANKRYTTEETNMIICSIFMLLLVFLGFLGTYWFRIQERTGEIAIRKALGATNTRVFGRLLSEGFILMAIATVFALAIDFLIVKKNILPELMGQNLEDEWYYAGMIVTTAVLFLMVVVGIYFPARRAMNINPSQALKDQ